MLETLTKGFKSAHERLSGVRELTEQNVEEALRDVRMSLLEADVDFQVVKEFLGRVKERGLGEKIVTRVRDAQGRSSRVPVNKIISARSRLRRPAGERIGTISGHIHVRQPECMSNPTRERVDRLDSPTSWARPSKRYAQ